MLLFKRFNIRSYEKGLYFKDCEFKGILNKGIYRFFDPLSKIKVEICNQRNPWILSNDLDLIVKSGLLDNHADILDLKDKQRALVWIDGRFEKVLGPGIYALWNKFCKIKIEIVNVEEAIFTHKDLHTISNSLYLDNNLNISTIEQGYEGVLFHNGGYIRTLSPGKYMFWKSMGKVNIIHVDTREKVADIQGQEMITADKVTLRINAVVNYRITDTLKSVTISGDSNLTIYRESQLAIREVIGSYDLDTLLNKKEQIINDLYRLVKVRATNLGAEINSVGIRDIILPGDMKTLMNKVIEAKKIADANLIMRREETAAIRSQANTAKLIENNPTLMRLKELDVLEKISKNSKLSVVLGEKGLTDKIINLV